MDKKIFNDNSVALKKDIRGKVYNSLQEALNDELLVRDIGVTVKILNGNEVVEYWWESDITDAGLVPKGFSVVYKFATQKINNIAELRKTVGKEEGQVIELLGYYEAGDKDSVRYKWTTAINIDNESSIISNDYGSWVLIPYQQVTILDFGIVNDNTIDQSLKLDALARYCDDNNIYEIDFLNYDILTSKTIAFTSTRGSRHAGITFKKCHKIKNLRISNDLSETLYQGQKLIQFIPDYYPNIEEVFELENISFNPYNPNFTIVSGEADGYMLGFGAFVNPSELINHSPLVETNFVFKFSNIHFESPAISYNMATADIFAKRIEGDNLSGEYWGLYYFPLAIDLKINNMHGIFRNDLHTGSNRLLVVSLIHQEAEIGSGTLNLKEWKISNSSCYDTSGRKRLVFKNHSVGKVVFDKLRLENCVGVFEAYAPIISNAYIKNIHCSNCVGDFNFNSDFDNLVIDENSSIELMENSFVRAKTKVINSVVIEDSDLEKKMSFPEAGFNTINILTIKNSSLPSDGDYGLFRNSKFIVKKLELINVINKSGKLFEGVVEELNINGLSNSTDRLGNYIYYRYNSNNIYTPKVNISNLKLPNSEPTSGNVFFLKDTEISSINYEMLTNSFTKKRIGNFNKEFNVFPLKNGTTANRPTGLNTSDIGTDYFDTSLNSRIVWNGTTWVSPLTTKSVSVSNITTPDATDLESALTLVNELKSKLNAKLTADRNSGQQAT